MLLNWDSMRIDCNEFIIIFDYAKRFRFGERRDGTVEVEIKENYIKFFFLHINKKINNDGFAYIHYVREYEANPFKGFERENLRNFVR